MRKPITAALILMSTVFLSGCSAKITDYPKQYKDYLDYTFNGNYTVEQKEKDNDHLTWEITYTDKQGNQRTTDLSSVRYEPDPDDQYGGSQVLYDADNIYAFATMESAAIVEEDMITNIVSAHLPELTYIPHQRIYQTDEYQFYFTCINVTAMQFFADESCCARAERYLAEGGDLKIAETDLKAAAQYRESWVVCQMILEADADAAYYEQIFRAIEADFCAAAESPQNYRFLLIQKQSDDEPSETLYCTRFIFGEPLDDADLSEDDSHAELHLLQSRLAEE